MVMDARDLGLAAAILTCPHPTPTCTSPRGVLCARPPSITCSKPHTFFPYVFDRRLLIRRW